MSYITMRSAPLVESNHASILPPGLNATLRMAGSAANTAAGGGGGAAIPWSTQFSNANPNASPT
jgi:hypothetical protein